MQPGCNEISMSGNLKCFLEKGKTSKRCSEIKTRQRDQGYFPPQGQMKHGQNSFTVY